MRRDESSKERPLGNAVKREEEFYVVELDDRLEFGTVLLGSDLIADDNSGCNNAFTCTSGNNTTACTNGRNC